MFEANPLDSMDSIVTKEPSDRSLLSIPDHILSSPLSNNTKPKETHHLNLESTCMNVEVVDDTMRDLDPFSVAPKALQLSPLRLAVREVVDFWDSS